MPEIDISSNMVGLRKEEKVYHVHCWGDCWEGTRDIQLWGWGNIDEDQMIRSIDLTTDKILICDDCEEPITP